MVAPALSQIAKLDGVRLVFRHFPLSTIHDKALLAAQAAEAAGLQGKFWEMHDILFEKQQDWSGLPLDRFELWLDSKVDSLKLDKEKFKQDLKSDSIVKKAAGI
jgi:protein-disulfide isomerase